ncbi:MAG: UDP-N-acetylmuramoyl-L-alanine--D-glutamate ligase [Saprospiraceae bacterium]|nr:UDP-N-acetylmuramoyl-L-alanine--D-glutamate ligase [Saprospiraceae bacterium]
MIVILGAGESGVGAALLAKKLGLSVFVSDQGIIRSQYKAELIEYDIDFEEGSHEIAEQLQPDILIKSPGIPEESEIVKLYKQNGINAISEIEFAYSYCKGIIIGITGSNGKTTTTNLCYHILNENGLHVSKCGNVGYSFARAVASSDFKYYVLELSSFQLDGIINFKPHIGILLNITADHLDRYQYNMELYIQSKFKITKNQTADDHLIVYNEDENIQKYLSEHPIQAKIISIHADLNDTGKLYQGNNLVADISTSRLQGRHNAINICSAAQVALLCGLSQVQVQAALDSFVNDPHRLEWLGSIHGVDYINDSKATNVDSVFWALDAIHKPLVWVAGGQDKGNDYSVLLPLVSKKVKALICLGLDNTKLIKTFSGIVPIIKDTQSMSVAIAEAAQIASAGDAILLSPACASFDLFKNYEDRGNQFKEGFKLLKIKNI